MTIGRSKAESFESLKSTIDTRLAGWKSKTLSLARRATLVKSVVSSMPLYTMSASKIPAQVCSQLDARARNFLWSGDANRSKLTCVSWDLICKSKVAGGLGIRSFKIMNKALIAKLG